MTMKFDPVTAAALNGATSKTLWCELLVLALGDSPRRLLLAHADSGDPFDEENGSAFVFRDVDMNGTISTAGAVLTNFGFLSNTRVKLAADLSTGVSEARISNTSGDRWVQLSYGLPTSGADIITGASPTTTSGEAINISILPPIMLPRGLGPAAPAWHSRTPRTVVLEKYVDGAYVEADRVDFTEQRQDVALSHLFLGGQIGDVAWWGSSRPLRMDGENGDAHWFFPQLFRHDASCSRTGTRPYETIWISARPVAEEEGDWYTFPARGLGDGGISTGTQVYDQNNPRHSTIPDPFRLRYLNDQGVEEGRNEWHDRLGTYPQGRPINDKTAVQNQFYNPLTGGKAPLSGGDGTGPAWGDAGAVVEPFWNIAQPIWWESDMPADMPPALMNGFQADVLIPQARYYSTTNPRNNQYARYGDQMLGLHFPWTQSEWPRSYGNQPRMTPIDESSSDPNNTGNSSYRTWAMGFRYMPGWQNGHDIDCGPGGQRFDRSAIPHQVALFLSDREGFRPEGLVPNRTIAWEFCKGYANLSRAFVKDNQLGSIDKAEGLAGAWNFKAAYYGASTRTQDKLIDMVITGTKAERVDYAGRAPYGWQLPEGIHHGYSHAAIGLLAFKDIRFAILQRFHWDTHWMSTLGYSGASTNPAGSEGHFGTRQGAWRFAAHTWNWLAGGEHPLLYSQSATEARFQTELQMIDSNIYQPAFVQNEQSLYMQGVKRFGQPMRVGTNVNGAVEVGGNLGYYLGIPAMIAYTSGFWDRMKARSVGCANGLFTLLHGLDTASIDWVMGTDAKWTGYVFSGDPNADGEPLGTNAGRMIASADLAVGTPTAADLPADWYGVPAVMSLDNLDAGFLKMQNGTFRITDWDPPQHCRAAWPSLRLAAGFEADYPKANTIDAHNRFAGYYAERTAWANEATTVNGRMSRNCRSRIVPMGFARALEEV